MMECRVEMTMMAGRGNGWTLRLATLLFGEPRARRRARLDPRMLNDHLKRDLGFLDGRATPGGHR